MAQRPTPETRNAGSAFWRAAAERKLVLPACTQCDKPFWHPRPHCPFCGSRDIEWRTASGRGSVYTYTVVRQSSDPHFREHVPYVVAMIELDEGPRIMSNVIDCAPEQVRIGMRVSVRFELVDAHLGIPLFAPEEPRA